MDIKLIALDMDGTLLNSEEAVSDFNREKIAQALAKDVHVVLSTGRWLNSCYPYAESLTLSSFLITCNGGEIWTFEKELKERHLLDPERVKLMWELANDMELRTWMISTDRIWYGTAPDNFSDREWLKFGCDSYDGDKLETIVKELSHYDDLELTNSMLTNIEVNPKGVSKASALNNVCKEIGISMDNVMAAGDSLNDIKMIQEAGVGVAMGNAQEAIKNVADYVTVTNNQHGVGKAIEKFVL
ncbi:5-amino-6-(5-phospho-D-ribitylamino)uracil phosphatase YcsE [Lentibacillus kapialis]|uniref:5-amino-6-(5-phospho-D-ribitylamino)uracil phosphatase YcsE n=1 Tax=Lentibacillus kapialis TaxID=340214 RepID=A0A917Q2D3_9BACI|nr:Cof-type HAD-IIB family hydrolase [Lentibacillus kapialis]GGK07668.1 5-amino-6-(5-phospho-D-ribitylamino)uracil phosphatase YcsE [Lentibacillus kapialis]